MIGHHDQSILRFWRIFKVILIDISLVLYAFFTQEKVGIHKYVAVKSTTALNCEHIYHIHFENF